MALVLLRLRLTIARRSRGTGAGAQLYFATTWVLGLVGGLLAGMGSSVLVMADGPGDLLLLVGFCSISLPWVIGPVVEPTLADGTVDPQRLEQFPLTGWQQVSGLLLGALVAPTAAFTFLFAAGGITIYAGDLLIRLAALVTAVLYTVMCVAVSRAVQALLAGALRSRRGTDIAALAASLLVLAVYLLAQQMRATAAGLVNQSAASTLGTVLSWTPPGAAGRAVLDARDGDWLAFTLRLSIVVITTGLALAAWVWVLGRRVDGATAATHRARSHRNPAELPLTPGVLRGLPKGPTLAATSQQLRYFFLRSPRAIQTLVIPPVMGVVVAHSSFTNYGLAAQTAAFTAMSVVAGSFNLFGYDGQGFTYLILGGAPLSRVLVGKALAPLLYLTPFVVAFAFVETILSGAGVAEFVSAVLAGISVVVLGLGVGGLSSVLNPSDQSRVGQRHGSFLRVLGWFMGFFTVAGIGGALWWMISRLAGGPLTGLMVLAVAAMLAYAMLRWAGRRVEAEPYAVMDKLDPRTS